jgi:small GTP-binding protein
LVYKPMLSRILDKQQHQLLGAEREVLTDLQVSLNQFDTAGDDLRVLQRSIRQLDELFLIVVVGEFNSGKSAFINALLGRQVLEEGLTPTTSRIHLVQYGGELEHATGIEDISVLYAPVELLEEINFVDTPGTNAILRHHEALTLDFVPRSDLVLFVTSADRPFTESERSFMGTIKDWGKKIVIVINKVDILNDTREVEHVKSFVADNVEKLLGFQPVIFPVSARDMLGAKLQGAGYSLLPVNRFPDLESYITSTLDQKERIRLKLLNPLGVGVRLVGKYRRITDDRLNLLREDRETIDKIDVHLRSFKEDGAREFRYRLADVDNVLHDFESRGMEFFDEYIRIGRFLDLVNKNRIKASFEREVVADMPLVIEKRVTEIIDWMVASDLRLWQSVVDQLRSRKSEHTEKVIGRPGEGFELNRNRLLETVGQSAQRAAGSFDREAEASRMAADVQLAVAGTALAEAGAVGLGAAVTFLATSAAVDVTGILAASVIAVVGLFVLPSKRHRAKKDFTEKVADIRKRLMKVLNEQFEREIDRSVDRIRESLLPYTGFVRGESERLEKSAAELAEIEARLQDLRARLGPD